MVAVSKGESGWDPGVEGDISLQDSTWGPSVGLWQVRSIKAQLGTGGERDYTKLKDPLFNAQSAWSISSQGTNFRPWSVYTRSTYKEHLNEAQGAITEAGLGDVDPAFYPQPTVARPSQAGSMHFNNTFVIQGGSGNSGIDTRRVVTMLADQLEGEMRRRMARVELMPTISPPRQVPDTRAPTRLVCRTGHRTVERPDAVLRACP